MRLTELIDFVSRILDMRRAAPCMVSCVPKKAYLCEFVVCWLCWLLAGLPASQGSELINSMGATKAIASNVPCNRALAGGWRGNCAMDTGTGTDPPNMVPVQNVRLPLFYSA